MAFWKRPTKSAPDFAQLEDRVMLSASPAALATANTSFDGQVDKLTPSTDYVLHVQAPDDDAGDPSYSGLETDQATASRRLDDPHTFRFESSPTADSLRYELVLIDEAAGDYQQLVDDLLDQQSDARQLDIAVLSSDRNGIEQISKILADYDQLDALHIVSHGSEGAVRLGNSWLNLENVGGYAGQLVGWRDALAVDADLMFYGCDLAGTEDGKILVESLSTLCDCDVAASDDDTGHAFLGGDWDLEYQIGVVESSTALSVELQGSWFAKLSLWLSTDSNVGAPGADGMPGGWTEGQVMNFAGPDLAHGASTDGDLSAVIDFDNFTLDATDSGALHFVSRNLTVGGANGTFDLKAGDVLVSFLQDETILAAYSNTGIDETYSDQDLLVFRPDSFGNYSAGTFYLLLDEIVTDDLKGVTLIEQDTTIGGTDLAAGSFLIIQETSATTSIDLFVPTGVGAGSTTGPITPLIDLSNLDIDANRLRGIELIEAATTVGGQVLAEGALLATLNVDDNVSGVAGNNLLVDLNDVFVLNLTSTGLGTTAGTATMFLDGSDVGLDDNPSQENPYALALYNYSQLIVDSTSDVSDGDTSSITALLLDNGADGRISLREAIEAANATPNGDMADVIHFEIPDLLVGGAHTIVVSAGGLPDITDSLIIDGSTEPDFVGTPIIRIDGVSAGASVDGLSFTGTSDGSTIRGLMITRFSRDGILIQSGADNISLDGNWIGTAGTGTTGTGNSDDGVDVRGSGATIGGTAANERNVITNSGDEGIDIVGTGVTGHAIVGNYIGLDPDGSTGSGNADVGIAIISGSGNTIGGSSAAARNVISNNYEGIEINTSDNVVQGNHIGTDASGTLNRGNRSDDGVEIQAGSDNVVGGTSAGAGNLIAFNARDGVNVIGGTNNSVLGNRIHSNSWLGVNLGTSGVTANDTGPPHDTDNGANNLQNYPILTSAVTDGGTTITIDGTLNSTAGTDFRIEFFASSAADPSGYGEAERYLGYANITTDGSGNATFSAPLSVAVSAGEFITATATDANGNTSEFSLNVVAAAVDSDPPSQVNNIGSTVAEGGTDTLTNTELRYDDSQQPASSVTYTVTVGLANGQLELTTDPGTAVTSFTQDDIDNNRLVYIHDGSETTSDSFNFDVDDGQGNTLGGQSFAISVTAVNDAPVIAAWYDTNWLYRKEIVIDAGQVSAALTDFPVLIQLATDAELASFAQVDGDDILFTAVDGTTRLAHEVEAFNPATGQLTAWVRSDLSGSTNTRIYIYYGNPLAASQQDPSAVWDAGFQGVWHLNNSPTGAVGEIQDSTANNNDGTTEGGMNAADLVAAKVGQGLDFDEVNDLIRVNDSASLDSTANTATIEAWVWWDDAADADHQIVMTSSNRFTGGARDGYEWASQGDGDHFYYPWGGADPNHVLGLNPFTNQQWHHVAVTQDFVTKDVEIYVDSVAMSFVEDHPPTTWTTLADPADWLWGGNPDRPSRYFDGMLDEIRVSNVMRSQDWIETTVRNQDDPGTFYSLGGAETEELMLTDVNEDDTNPAGNAVAVIVSSAGGDPITDVDGDPEGIAVIGVDNTNGNWQYDAGGGWADFGSVSSTSAVLLNSAAKIRFVPHLNYSGSAGNISFRAWDQTTGSSGQTGVDVSTNGGTTAFSTSIYSASTNVTPVNDDPTNAGSLPSDIAVNEDVLSDVDLSPLDLNDVDVAAGSLAVTLTTSTGGNLSATSGGGVTVGGSGTGTLTLDGTQAALNTFLDTASNIQYLHGTPGTAGDNADTIQIEIADNGNTGAGGGGTINLGTVNVDIGDMNAPPINTVPGTQTVAEETPTAIAGISISDADAGAGILTTRLEVTGSVLNVALAGGATISAGANGTNDLTILGTVADINATLVSLIYAGNTDVVGVAADTLTVTTNDQGNTGSGGPQQDVDTVQIDITPVNDDPTNAGSLPSDIAVQEDVASDADLSALDLSDVDAGAGSLTVALTTSTGGSLLATSGGGVTVAGSGTGALTLTGTQTALNTFLDTASNIQYLHGTPGTTGDNADTIQVDVTDNGNTGAGGGGTINLGTVNVDIADGNAPPVITTTNLNAAENQTSAGTVVAADPDVPANTLTWSLTGSGWDDGLFTINSGTGQLTFNSAPDFEVPGDANADNVYEVEVRVNDGTVDTTKLITITVTDSNESPTVNPATFSLAENSISGMSVGIVIAVDPDGGDSLTYTITGGNTGSAFAINSSTGGITVANSAALDFESTPTFNIAVQVADTGGLTDTAAVTINLTDVNEAPVTVDDTFTVSETAANGTLIGIVSGSDADVGQTLSYAITAGDPTNVFAINASTGEITVNDSSQLDILTTPSYTLTVGVTDDGAPPRTSAATITILVTDVNQPPIVNDQSFSIVENAADGASVGTVIFNDPDFFDTHSFFITGGSGATAFAVNVSTGEITVADSSQLDYEVTTSFTLDVVVTDDGSPNRSDSATITVNLHPLNDNVPVGMTESATVVFGESVSVFDSKNSSVLDNDRDADVPADTLTTILNSGPSHAASFTLNPDGTFLYVHDGSDVQIDSFTYRISDGTNTSDPVTVTINIMPLDVPDDSPIDNDPPRDDPPDNEPPDDDPSDDEPPAEVIPPRKVPTPPDRPRPRHPTQRDPSDERREQHGPSVGIPIDGPSEVIGEEGLIFFNTGSDHLSVGFRHSVEVLSDTASDLAAFVDPQLLFEKLNDFQEGLKQNDQAIKLTIGSVAIASLGVTAGYVFWTVKGGYLLASVLSNMPAWRFIDPLPIYDAAAGGYWEDEKEKENVRIS